MFNRLKVPVIVLPFLMLPLPVAAQTQYITDDFEVMLRTGPSVQNKIIRPLRSGTDVTILEEDAGNGHSQVRAGSGEIGYVISRFISDQPSARNQLASVQAQLEELQSNPSELQTLLTRAQNENQRLIELNVNLTDELRQVKNELTNIKRVSDDVVSVAEKNNRLESEVRKLLLQVDDIRIQKETLEKDNETSRRLVGAGLIVLGLFLGWILSISGRRYRGSWGGA